MLRLLGQRQLQKDLNVLSAVQWRNILQIADQHRTLALIHGRLERGEIEIETPTDIREELRKAHRESALTALAHRAELFSTVELLRSAGLETVALKGASLAWYSYPAAAERPLRDIDLLLQPEQALAAFNLLREHGFVQSDPSALPAEQMVGAAKHLPPLTSPSGIEFEIHMHAWEPPGSTEWTMPPLMDERIFSDAQPAGPGDPCRYPKPYHMLIHLVVHAAYSHRFDVGPLVLSDIGFLLDSHSIDWLNFWRDADQGGYANGAVLVLALVQKWISNGQIGWLGAPAKPPAEVLNDCERLLVQNLAQRKNVGAAAAIINAGKAGGIGELGRRLKAKLSGKQRGVFASDTMQREKYLPWLFRRGASFAASMTAPESRSTAAQMARVGQYLSRQK
ncbi:hypothetical protein GCM10023115_06410 [Pontixanthobacter gangjinensis]|uniref:Uncharacterized protein n=1 Tax=Pontixanthobacter gangjinensis TaxID=1028742 RepID=A0A6I4SL77_9SPHN|nr:nucleotidyltransferase family protein [Pontixanthobacter gangjinensis]MXO55890.1 hypothetical protein [Pontixanthobacter gangjinensis]